MMQAELDAILRRRLKRGGSIERVTRYDSSFDKTHAEKRRRRMFGHLSF